MTVNTYTVVAALRGGLIWEVRTIQAATPTLAGRKVRHDFCPDNPENVEILAVFEGAHRDQYEPSLDTAEYEQQIAKEGNPDND